MRSPCTLHVALVNMYTAFQRGDGKQLSSALLNVAHHAIKLCLPRLTDYVPVRRGSPCSRYLYSPRSDIGYGSM